MVARRSRFCYNKRAMIYIENASTDPAYNLALEEYAFSECSEDVLLLWRSTPCVVCGKYQNVYREVDVLAAHRHSVPLLRRESGGGAVYHDPGNINYSYILPAETGVSYARAIEPMISALRKLGIPAERRGASEIAVLGKKISGSAQRQSKGRALSHGTLLFDADLAALNALTARPDEVRTRSKGVKSQPSEVVNMRPLLQRDMDAAAFLIDLRAHLPDPGTPVRLTAAEDARVRALAAEKYRDWAWNYGRSPAFTRANARPPLEYAAREGRIEHLSLGGVPLDAFQGQRLEVSAIEGICQKIAETPSDAEALLRAIF